MFAVSLGNNKNNFLWFSPGFWVKTDYLLTVSTPPAAPGEDLSFIFLYLYVFCLFCGIDCLVSVHNDKKKRQKIIWAFELSRKHFEFMCKGCRSDRRLWPGTFIKNTIVWSAGSAKNIWTYVYNFFLPVNLSKSFLFHTLDFQRINFNPNQNETFFIVLL